MTAPNNDAPTNERLNPATMQLGIDPSDALLEQIEAHYRMALPRVAAIARELKDARATIADWQSRYESCAAHRDTLQAQLAHAKRLEAGREAQVEEMTRQLAAKTAEYETACRVVVKCHAERDAAYLESDRVAREQLAQRKPEGASARLRELARDVCQNVACMEYLWDKGEEPSRSDRASLGDAADALRIEANACVVDKFSSRVCAHGTKSCEEPRHYAALAAEPATPPAQSDEIKELEWLLSEFERCGFTHANDCREEIKARLATLRATLAKPTEPALRNEPGDHASNVCSIRRKSDGYWWECNGEGAGWNDKRIRQAWTRRAAREEVKAHLRGEDVEIVELAPKPTEPAAPDAGAKSVLGLVGENRHVVNKEQWAADVDFDLRVLRDEVKALKARVAALEVRK